MGMPGPVRGEQQAEGCCQRLCSWRRQVLVEGVKVFELWKQAWDLRGAANRG